MKTKSKNNENWLRSFGEKALKEAGAELGAFRLRKGPDREIACKRMWVERGEEAASNLCPAVLAPEQGQRLSLKPQHH